MVPVIGRMLRRRRQSAEAGAAVTRAGGGGAAGGGLTLLPGAGLPPPRRGTAALLRAYGEMPWLRAAAAKVAFSVAAVPWRVSVARGGRAVARPEHPLARLLEAGTGPRDDALPGLTGLEVRKVTVLHLDLVGEAFWLLERNRAGLPVGILPIPPHWVRTLPRAGGAGWLLQPPGAAASEVPARDLVMFRDVDPEQPYGRGCGVGAALADELATDEQAAKYVGAYLANRARPDLIVAGTGEQPLSREEVERLEVAWSNKFGGPHRSGRPFFSSGPLNVVELGQSLRDNQMREIRAFERDTIVSVYGLPPEKLGILQHANRSTIEAADLFFAKEVLLPRLRLLRGVIVQRLAPEFGAGLEVDFDNPVEEDRAFKLKVLAAAREHVTRNELRALAGLPPVAGGDVLAPVAGTQAQPEGGT